MAWGEPGGGAQVKLQGPPPLLQHAIKEERYISDNLSLLGHSMGAHSALVKYKIRGVSGRHLWGKEAFSQERKIAAPIWQFWVFHVFVFLIDVYFILILLPSNISFYIFFSCLLLAIPLSCFFMFFFPLSSLFLFLTCNFSHNTFYQQCIHNAKHKTILDHAKRNHFFQSIDP